MPHHFNGSEWCLGSKVFAVAQSTGVDPNLEEMVSYT